MVSPLTKKAPNKPYKGKPLVRIWAGGEVTRVLTANLIGQRIETSSSPVFHSGVSCFLPAAAWV